MFAQCVRGQKYLLVAYFNEGESRKGKINLIQTQFFYS